MFGDIKNAKEEKEEQIGIITKKKYRDKQGRPITLFIKKTINSYKVGYIDYILKEHRIHEYYFNSNSESIEKSKAYSFYSNLEHSYDSQYKKY